ncbi:hypothetical protein PCE31106_03571 [Pandoraea cepalis]|uniref:DUF1468 domain-containing protein n=1 Tax=Pandoraea cepalis TaxID=2508294 RepID=A0A5E4X015_9BURK|nr:tripartite tricarboxylate transporter TctB family protein [Pandoraea cepalis]VVE29626.1 hypothetical protein PCE31106_03571 [Pandoraea cepalis]
MKQQERIDKIGGFLLFIVAIAILILSRKYGIGTLKDIGPGFFPMLLGAALAVMGIILLTIGRSVPDDGESGRFPDVRGACSIVASILAFIFLSRELGLLIGSTSSAFIAALGDRRNTIRSAAGLAIFMGLFSMIVFWWLLKLQLPIIGGWK